MDLNVLPHFVLIMVLDQHIWKRPLPLAVMCGWHTYPVKLPTSDRRCPVHNGTKNTHPSCDVSSKAQLPRKRHGCRHGESRSAAGRIQVTCLGPVGWQRGSWQTRIVNVQSLSSVALGGENDVNPCFENRDGRSGAEQKEGAH